MKTPKGTPEQRGGAKHRGAQQQTRATTAEPQVRFRQAPWSPRSSLKSDYLRSWFPQER